MADTCPQLISCCPPTIWQVPPGIQSALSGLLWVIPCINNYAPQNCTCADPATPSAILSGLPGDIYDVTLRIRGVVELNGYSGGSVVTGTSNHCYKGGTYTDPVINVYKLMISNPLAYYFVNNSITGFQANVMMDYQFTVQMSAGATISMPAFTLDAKESSNFGNLVVPVGPTDPPILVTQPFNGEFVQMDVVSIA